MDILIAYFSLKGSNFVNGKIVELEKGNTEVAAEKIYGFIKKKADKFKIETVKEYPNDHLEIEKIAIKEFENNERPELKYSVENMEQYKTVILGYPIWQTTLPVAVVNFLQSYDFSGKTIIPFCTHEGSGEGFSFEDLHRIFPNGNVQLNEVLAIEGSKVKKSDRDIKNWLKKNGLI